MANGFQEIEVNGEIVEFPTSMSDDQISAAIRAQSDPNKGLQGFLASEGQPDPSISGFFDALQSVGTGAFDLFGKAAGTIAGGVAAAPVAFSPEAPQILSNVAESVSAPFAAETDTGQQVSEALSFPFQAAEKGADVASEFLGAPGGPGLQTAIKTGLLGIPALATPTRNIGRGGRVLSEKPLTLKQNVLKEAQAEGYAVPASNANPSSTALGAVEGLAGKPRMNQEASFSNQRVTNNLAAKELRMPEGADVTLASIDRVRSDAGKAYSVLQDAGTITPTVLFRRDLSKAIADLKSASADFPILAKADSPVAGVIQMAEGLNKPTFQSSSVIAATKILRDEAGSAFRNGQPKVGQAYRDLSKALEDAAERHLENFGDPAAVQAFRDARVQIAKSFSVEKALTGDGFVSASKLASQRSKRSPLTGNLDLIARFAEQFPEAVKVIKNPPIQTGRLTSTLGILGATGAGIAGSPLAGIPALAMAFGGPATRSSILSRLGQSTLAKPKPALTGAAAAEAGILESALLADDNQ